MKLLIIITFLLTVNLKAQYIEIINSCYDELPHYTVLDYISKSSFVVRGKPIRESEFNFKAKFIIKDQIKGQIKQDTILVKYFRSDELNFVLNTNGIILLLENDGDSLFDVNKSYVIRNAEFEKYKEQLKQIDSILTNNAENKDRLIKEWLFQCLSVPSLHYDAVYELVNDYAKNLTSSDTLFLRKYLLQVDQLQLGDENLIKMVKEETDSMLLAFMKDRLVNIDDDHLHLGDLWFNTIIKLWDLEHLRDKANFGFDYIYKFNADEKRQEIHKFINLL